MDVTLKLIAAVGCALVGGVFFAFSGFVMPALARVPPATGIAAMQAINVTAVRAPLMLAMFGTAALCAVVAARAALHWSAPGSPWLLGGGLTYVFGCVVSTIAFNVPLNNALAAVAPDSAAGADLWSRYLVSWTAWNHARTAACLAAAASMLLA